MQYVVLLYLIGAGFWLIYWLPMLESYFSNERGKQRAARYILATPIWPIITILFIISGFIELVRIAR